MISAVVLAAGRSTRMKRSKLMLPWGNSTVIGSILATLAGAGVDNVVLVTGDAEDNLKRTLIDFRVRYVRNPDYKNGEMITSVQVGLMALSREIEAALIVLGDQPQIEEHVVKRLLEIYASNHGKIIVPSFQMHRGHPWLIERKYWDDILNIIPPHNLRDFLSRNQDQIVYVHTNTPSVIQDLDTPEDYHMYQP